MQQHQDGEGFSKLNLHNTNTEFERINQQLLNIQRDGVYHEMSRSKTCFDRTVHSAKPTFSHPLHSHTPKVSSTLILNDSSIKTYSSTSFQIHPLKPHNQSSTLIYIGLNRHQHKMYCTNTQIQTDLQMQFTHK